MTEIIKQALAELRSVYNIIHGPEIWIVFPLLMLVAGIVGFEVFSRWEEDDDD